MRSTILFLLFSIGILLPEISFAGCPGLLAISPDVEKYALDISSEFKSNSSLENKVKHIIKCIHSKNGLNPKFFSPDKFFKLHTIFKGEKTTRIEQIKEIPEFKGLNNPAITAYAQIYNKYMVPDARGIIFAPTASDIINYRMAFGCTHYARAFIAIAKALKLFNPKDMRYVVSSSYRDYNKACPGKYVSYNSTATINGHQFVLLRYDNRWWFVNTSNKKFEKVPAGELNYHTQNLIIRFPSYAKNSDSGHNMLLVRYIGKDSDDGACDNSFANLMNISVSGSTERNICFWARHGD